MCIQGADGIRAPIIIRKKNMLFIPLGIIFNGGGESDTIASIRCEKIDYAGLSLPYFSKDPKSFLPSAPAKS